MFSAAVLDHTLNPRNAGPLSSATHFGQYGEPGGGPYVQMWLVISDDEPASIVSASYSTYGCPAAVACASLTCELLKGRSLENAMKLEARDLVLLLGGVPEGKEFCANMAVDALRQAMVTKFTEVDFESE